MSTDQMNQVCSSIVTSLFEIFQSEGKIIKSHRLLNDVISTGNNFCSGISKLIVEYEQDGVSIEKSFILKIPSVSQFYKQLSDLHMYQNEVIVYAKILPAMRTLLDHSLTPNSYLLPDTDNLVLDDLNEHGYVLMEKKPQLDLNHSIAALESLATFHALSLKLYEVSPEIIDAIVVPAREDTPASTPNTLFDKFNNTVEVLPLPVELRRKVQDFQFKHIPKAFNETMVPSDGLNVLCHGDFWLGNLLFKHEDERVSDVKLLDFQMVHRCSPVIDLIEFFVTSVRFEVYEANRDTLIERYLKKFNDLLHSLKSGSKYTTADLAEDMRKYKLFFVYNLGAYMPAVLNDKEDPFNYSGRDTQIYSSDLFKNALLKWIIHLNDEGMM